MDNKLVIIAALLFGISSLHFQLIGQKPNTKWTDPDDFPYQLNPQWDLILVPASTTLFVLGGVKKLNNIPLNTEQIQNLNPANLNFLDIGTFRNWNPRLNTLRESFEPASILAGTGLVVLKGIQAYHHSGSLKPALTLLTMYAEGLFLSQGVLWWMKAYAQRPRPYAYNSNLSLESRAASSTNNESFFSGNSTVLFYSSTFISELISDFYPGKKWTPYVWLGTYSISIMSGFLSVKSGMHFPTDVIVGAIWGTGTGFLVTKLHKKQNQRIALFPWAGKNTQGATLLVNLNKN